MSQRFWTGMDYADVVDLLDKFIIGKNIDGSAKYSNINQIVKLVSAAASSGIEAPPVPGSVLPNLGEGNKITFLAEGTYRQPTGSATLVVPADMLTIGFWDGVVWTAPISMPLPASENKIKPWVPGVYFAGRQVLYEGQIWTSLSNTLDSDEPSLSNKWKPDIDKTNRKDFDSLVNFQFGKPMDWEATPKMTKGKYINKTGGVSDTPAGAYAASLDYIPLYGASEVHYRGRVGQSSTRIAFYASATGGQLGIFPLDDSLITDATIPTPPLAKYIRVTCGVSDLSIFKLTLRGLVLPKTALQSFRAVGIPIYENFSIKESDIVWNDNSTGRVVYGDWNEDNLTFTSFEATSIENSLRITQPPVTFDSDNLISKYPNFIISAI